MLTMITRTVADVGERVDRTLFPVLLRLMFLIPPERVHRIVAAGIRVAMRLAPLRGLTARICAVDDPVLHQDVFGVAFPAPLGLAAGFDKSASAAHAWGAMGFGYAEVGTITGRAQPGNPEPRLFRLPRDHALVNRMGFNNPGADVAADHLRAPRPGPIRVPIGANIGKSKAVAIDEAVADYRYSARLLGPLTDFVVVNVSSPNTPGLRDLQAVDALRPILRAVLDEVTVPVLVKIAPDLADPDIDTVADLAVELGLAGIVATNTTIGRDGLRTPADTVAAMGAGGLSGPPVADRSLAVLRRLRARVGGQIALVSVGGISTADQAWERICSGADLLQTYTGFIYGGPMGLRRIHTGLADRVRAAGYTNLSEAVGSDTR